MEEPEDMPDECYWCSAPVEEGKMFCSHKCGVNYTNE